MDMTNYDNKAKALESDFKQALVKHFGKEFKYFIAVCNVGANDDEVQALSNMSIVDQMFVSKFCYVGARENIGYGIGNAEMQKQLKKAIFAYTGME